MLILVPFSKFLNVELITNQIVLFVYAPINIMSHYPPYGQMAGNIGALTKEAVPIVGHLISSEDTLNTAMVSVYCTVTLHGSNPQ